MKLCVLFAALTLAACGASIEQPPSQDAAPTTDAGICAPSFACVRYSGDTPYDCIDMTIEWTEVGAVPSDWCTGSAGNVRHDGATCPSLGFGVMKECVKEAPTCGGCAYATWRP